MKILYYSYSIPKPNRPQGVFISQRISHLLKEKIDLVVCTSSSLYSHSFTSKNPIKLMRLWGKEYTLTDIGIDSKQVVTNLRKIENPYNYLNLFKEKNLSDLRKIYLKNRCDLIHCHFVRDGIYANELKRRYNTPYVVTAHASDIYDMPFRSPRLKLRTLEVLHEADHVIFVSKAMLKIAIELGYTANNCSVIHNGYDQGLFKYNKKNNSPVIAGFVGNLIKQKRAEYLPGIFDHVLRKSDSYEFWIIGQGVLERYLRSEVQKLALSDKVKFFGQVSQKQLSILFAKMNLLILPSVREGFPTVVAEAIGSGVIPVVSDCEGSVEAVGNAGYIVPYGENYEARFAEQILNIQNESVPDEIILSRGKDLSWSQIIKQEINVYKKILSVSPALSSN